MGGEWGEVVWVPGFMTCVKIEKSFKVDIDVTDSDDAVDAEALEDHLQSCNLKNCPRCKYEATKKALRARCSYIHPVTKKHHTWLMVNIGADSGKSAWGLGCVLCRWAGEKGPYSKCTKRNLSKLERHGNTVKHMDVVRSWSDKVLANSKKGSGGKTPMVTHGGKTPMVTHGGKTPMQSGGVGYGHILKMLEIFEEQAPLRSFTEKLGGGR